MLRYKEWTCSVEDSDVKHKITAIRLYSGDGELICMEFKPVHNPPDGVIRFEDWNCYDSFTVYKTDYEKLLLPSIESIFPVMDPDPEGWGLQEQLDLCSLNWLGREDWIRLTEVLSGCFDSATEPEKEFYSAVLERMRKFMEISDIFCIEGNL